MTTTAPSQFAQLLSRSKFATYDPAIAQIYTSHGGYAYRGQFGLKRALPKTARKRHPLVTVKAVDTPESQTDWDPAHEQGGNWMKMWKEMGVGAEAEPQGSWSKKMLSSGWEVDSDFDQSKAFAAKIQGAQAAWKSVDHMTPKQFEKYLEETRKLRPEFKKFLEKKRQAAHSLDGDAGDGLFQEAGRKSSSILPPPSEPLNMGDLATNTSSFHVDFIREQANAEQFYNLKSTQITPKPHPNAGLSYSPTNVFQETVLHPAQPGRIINKSPVVSMYAQPEGVALVAGNVTLPQAHNLKATPVTFSELEGGKETLDRGEAMWRISSARVKAAPEVVHAYQKPKVDVFADRRGEESSDGPFGFKIAFESFESNVGPSANQHRLGTAESIAWRPPKIGTNAVPMTTTGGYFANISSQQVAGRRRPAKAESQSVGDVLGLVNDMMKKTTRGKP